MQALKSEEAETLRELSSTANDFAASIDVPLLSSSCAVPQASLGPVHVSGKVDAADAGGSNNQEPSFDIDTEGETDARNAEMSACQQHSQHSVERSPNNGETRSRTSPKKSHMAPLGTTQHPCFQQECLSCLDKNDVLHPNHPTGLYPPRSVFAFTPPQSVSGDCRRGATLWRLSIATASSLERNVIEAVDDVKTLVQLPTLVANPMSRLHKYVYKRHRQATRLEMANYLRTIEGSHATAAQPESLERSHAVRERRIFLTHEEREALSSEGDDEGNSNPRGAANSSRRRNASSTSTSLTHRCDVCGKVYTPRSLSSLLSL